MPRLSVWSIRIALVYLVVGWSLGAVLMVNRAVGWSASLWRLVDLHVAMALFGWTFLLVIAVAYRMLPTFGSRSNRSRSKAAWTSVVAVNLGVFSAAGTVFWAGPWWLVSTCLWTVAAVAFGWHLWPRVKAFGS